MAWRSRPPDGVASHYGSTFVGLGDRTSREAVIEAIGIVGLAE